MLCFETYLADLSFSKLLPIKCKRHIGFPTTRLKNTKPKNDMNEEKTCEKGQELVAQSLSMLLKTLGNNMTQQCRVTRYCFLPRILPNKPDRNKCEQCLIIDMFRTLISF